MYVRGREGGAGSELGGVLGGELGGVSCSISVSLAFFFKKILTQQGVYATCRSHLS